MKRIPFQAPLFIQTYSAKEMEDHILQPEIYGKVTEQLNTRYFNPLPSYEPTEQEKKWGIETIHPASAYWTHFRSRLECMHDLLKADPESNRAVITIDFQDGPPCFQSFQFKVRDGGVHCFAFARSLDLENGLAIDAPIFWEAAVCPLVQSLELDLSKSTLTIITPGAHVYSD